MMRDAFADSEVEGYESIVDPMEVSWRRTGTCWLRRCGETLTKS